MSGDVDGNSSDAGDSADESRKGGDQGSISTPMNSGHDLAPVAAVNGGDIWSSPQRGPTGPFGGPFGLPAAGPPYPPNPSYPTSGDPAPSLHPHPSFSYAGNNNPMYYSQTGHSPPQGQPPLGDGGNGQAQALAYINAGYYHPHAAVGNHAPDADQRAMSYDPPLTNSSSSINDVGGGGHGHPRRHEELLQLLSSAATYPSHGGMSSTDDGDNALTTINQATSSSTSERLRLKAILSD
ncbi:hypothetical protein M427DRAFT_412617 [Gonapodya prolifera JEL478]|uniref:Uncharacterized protein n=1 Tax=Gonapodya prolifera (strain JEL478) TaxID=1344416 RepID=A0A139A6R7_GONPJ|nr:hypothetical protein M427DRAFT_412617 [Gonapodya prolifera JEL478]|eukprot:KXS12033.1 hypothetical protein M427DRAFT_412617 [Gonapodya prolifera JEL478]